MVQADNHRESIRASLVAKAEGYCAEWENIEEVLVDEPEINYMAKRFYNDDGIPVVMCKYRCEGMTLEHLAPFLENPEQIAETLHEGKVKHTMLDDHQGCKIAHMQFIMPMFFTNRSIISCKYYG